MSVQITEKAYGKVVLHAAKYHSQAVGGFLVGSAEGADVRVEDVLPVYHGNPVGPVFEVAWALFEGQAPWAGGRSRVVGLYYAHEVSALRRRLAASLESRTRCSSFPTLHLSISLSLPFRRRSSRRRA